MQIRFDAESHTYFNEKGFIVPSTTEVLGAVYGTGLENAPAEFIERAAQKGTKIHKEIELFIKKEPLPEVLMPETKHFIDYANKHLDLKTFAKTEMILWAKTPYGEICGTTDLFTSGFLNDYKTSKTATKDQRRKWQMQLSIYRYMAQKMGLSVLGTKVLHLTEEGCEEIEMEYLGDEWVENTMRLYSEGKRAEEKQATTALESVSQKELLVFADRLKRIKDLEEEIAGVKEIIQAEMEKRNILALEVGDVSITYVAPTTRKSFDSTKFKAEHADLYKEYQKESSVKGCIKIKVK